MRLRSGARHRRCDRIRFSPPVTKPDRGRGSLNLAIWLGDEMQKILQEGNRHLPEYQGNNAWMLPIPATFVVAQDGIITARFIDPDYRKRMSIEDLLSALRSAQSQGEFGQ
jgi:hypothetical protein